MFMNILKKSILFPLNYLIYHLYNVTKNGELLLSKGMQDLLREMRI